MQLAEIGVILLMFGVGLHFSVRDLVAVAGIAVPGAMAQIAVATALGVALAAGLGWPPASGLVFGLALSVASTVVLLRALEERDLIETRRGRTAVGRLIVEDLAMVLALVLLPVAADLLAARAEGEAPLQAADVVLPLAATIAKVGALVALMLIVGARLIPWALHRVAGAGSRELFTLAVLATALGIAIGSAELFGVSFALGAFFAGMVLAGSELSHRAAEDSLPLRDAFAVLFFVAVGMLLDPAVLVEMPLAALATVLIIVVGKSLAAYAIVRLFGHDNQTALTISAGLAQIGEFSFILATLGVSLGLLTETGQDLILAGAILSILLNPLVFAVFTHLAGRPENADAVADTAPGAPPELAGHAVLAGCGELGLMLVADIVQGGQLVVVIENDPERADAARRAGATVVGGAATRPDVLCKAGIDRAKWLFVAMPDVFEAGQVAERAQDQPKPAHRRPRGARHGGRSLGGARRGHGNARTARGRARQDAGRLRLVLATRLGRLTRPPCPRPQNPLDGGRSLRRFP